MAEQKPDSPEALAATLSIPERLLLFCVASKTVWKKSRHHAQHRFDHVVRGLIERDRDGQLHFSEEGRAVLKALVVDELE
jgi:hypothetical protein